MKNFLKNLGIAIIVVWIYKGAYRGFQKALGLEIDHDDNSDIHISLIILGCFIALIFAVSSQIHQLAYLILALNFFLVFTGILFYLFKSE
ncbi:hypothetical protein [Jiulongibacter sediminis]|uniref:hypothetical protein n=1 Tax=Jiulongibacter sediminis TaxID=1605367 RepID=UPI0026ECBC4E|nr:hypothetical protein [Jiulongibacter sediminis]